ncbi:C-reactive protein 1.4-like [Ciona intestinalis]
MKTTVLLLLSVAWTCSGRSSSNSANISTTFHFPTAHQTTDWIRYIHYFPNLQEVTACAWVTPYDLSYQSTLFSYAINGNFEEFTVFLDGPALLRVLVSQTGHDVIIPTLHENEKTHICFWFSQSLNQVGAQINGIKSNKVVYLGNNYIQGGGKLFFGQEQDSLGGSFDSQQSFSGEITDFTMWPRVLDSIEMAKIATTCEYPHDIILQPTIDKIEKNGDVTITYSEKCNALFNDS